MRLIQALKKEQTDRPPFWMMRQAGRYLPEYRALRSEAGSFLKMCYTPSFATEVTLQPIRRFDFDAAILFSDILVIPHALGCSVDFLEGEGPVVEKILSTSHGIERNKLEAMRKQVEQVTSFLSPVMETVHTVRKQLAADKALIGFCGAPWTLALYLLEEKPSKSADNARKVAYAFPEAFDELLEVLVQASIQYLHTQIAAGANAVQIFDSWASLASDALFERVVQKPLLAICAGVKAVYPEVPIVLFPRAVSAEKLQRLTSAGTGLFEGLGVDYGTSLSWASEHLQASVALQGNLDPAILLTDPETVRKATQAVLEAAGHKPGFVFNLGHGILPPTPLENVAAMAETVKNWRG